MKSAHGPQPDIAQDPGRDLLRGVRLCHPGWEEGGALTFLPRGRQDAWRRWTAQYFATVLHPQIEASWAAAMSGGTREVLACDRVLNEMLPPELAAASRREGARLLRAFTPPPAEKLWTRYLAKWADDESAAGHLCVVMAVRAAAFHIPLPLLAQAYLFLEARGGCPGAGDAAWEEMTGEAAQGLRTPTIRFAAA